MKNNKLAIIKILLFMLFNPQKDLVIIADEKICKGECLYISKINLAKIGIKKFIFINLKTRVSTMFKQGDDAK